ncbi:potassium voltage-gated channel protein Shal-like isoform X1 [Apis florea]|uniref:potassium voltage-gated channel protein Shal-like isoform X1 n=1 Tax=Apis florea TaxID=7463 RepID=UPI000629B4BC|nr:potassium voltage-gated channel protein Shal-like isoform X1 [Apis florea]
MKARLARIRIAKASSGAAFVSKKKAAEARLAAQESGLQLDDNYKEEDIFELQHHHLLRCLEKTTDREFVEMEVPYNGAPKRPGSPSPLTSPAHSTASRGGLLHACCGRCYPQRYQSLSYQLTSNESKDRVVLVYEDRIQVRKKVKKTVLPENRFGYDDNRCTLHTMLYRFVAFVRALHAIHASLAGNASSLVYTEM